MIVVAKSDIPNKYKEPRKSDRPMTIAERKAYKRAHPNAKEEDLIVTELLPYMYCKAGDKLTVITNNPGEWCIVVIVENDKRERFSVRWDDLKTHT